MTPKHTYILDPSKSEWADYAAVQAECGNLSGNELTQNSSGNTQSQSSQLAEPLWTDPGLKSGIGLHKLISSFKKKKVKHYSKTLHTQREKSHHHCSTTVPAHLIIVSTVVVSQG